jgi:predicted HAD superfamily Cof-like phosphohydrolase
MEDGQQYKRRYKLMSNFTDVKTFMETFGQIVRTKPQFPDEKTMQLRYDLIKEELNELEQAMKSKDLKEIADALTDILYVTYGAGFAYGIDLDKCFKEVQRANMSKLGKDGKPIFNEKGKVMKGPNYSEPNLKQFVE